MTEIIKKSHIGRTIVNWLGIALGSLLLAVSYSWFLMPYNMAPGGVGGIAQIIYHFTGILPGTSMIIINIPLFVLGFLVLGRIFGVRSFYGMFLSSVLTDLIRPAAIIGYGWTTESFFSIAGYQDGNPVYALLGPGDIYLSAIAGSVILGVGLGIIFRFRGSTGGTDIPVAILKQKTGISLGTGYWVVETLIILSIGLVFADPKLIILGYINLFITTKITDISAEGLPYTKGVFIMSDLSDDVRAEIFSQLNRGVTIFQALGGYTDAPKRVIFCVVSRRQVADLRDIVRDIDPKAFMVVTDVNDVMGLGFKSRNLDLKQENQ